MDVIENFWEHDKPLQQKKLQALMESDNICEDLDDQTLATIGKRCIEELDIDLSCPARQAKLKKWQEGKKLVKQDIMDAGGAPWQAKFKYPLIAQAAIQFSAHAAPVLITPQGVVKSKIIGKERKKQKQQAEQGAQAMQPGSMPAPMSPQSPQAMQPLSPMPPQQQQSPPQMSGLAQAAGLPGGLPPMPQQQERDKDEVADNVADYMNYQLLCDSDWPAQTDNLLLWLSLFGKLYRKSWYSTARKKIIQRVLTPMQFIVPSNVEHLEDAPRMSEFFTLTSNEIESKIRSGEYRDFEYQRHAQPDSEHPHDFIEQHRYLDLDEDGYKEPYIVTIHKDTDTVCRIVTNFSERSVTISEDNKVIHIKKDEYYSDYTFIPSLDEESPQLSSGFFDLLSSTNRGINAITNLLLDAGTLANSNSGFIGRDLKMNRQPLRFSMGEYKAVNASGNDIRKGLVTMQWPGPNTVLFSLLQFLIQVSRELANTKDIMENAKNSNTPATTTLALIEQGQKISNAIYKRIHRSFKKEFKILLRLNAEHADTQKYQAVMDTEVRPEDFLNEGYDFDLVADPEESSDLVKMAKAEFLMSMKGDPTLNPIKINERILSAANVQNIDELIMPPQPQADPKIELEKQRLEVEKLKFQLETMKLEMQKSESDSKILKNRTAAIKDLATAEAQEAGQQLQQYQLGLQEIENARQRELDERDQIRADRQQELDAIAARGSAQQQSTDSAGVGMAGLEEQSSNPPV